MRIVHEWLGDLELPGAPGRVVSLAPSATETVFVLGGGERLMGRSSFCYRPDAPRLVVDEQPQGMRDAGGNRTACHRRARG